MNTEYSSYDDDHVFNSDNKLNMMKAFCDTLSCLFLFCFHITCHKPHYKFRCFRYQERFQRSDLVYKMCPQSFRYSKWKKSRFLNFQQRTLNPGNSVTMLPNPTYKTWSAWFTSSLKTLSKRNVIEEEMFPILHSCV